SQQRAQAAADYLINEEAIPKTRVEVRWFGDAQPVASNTRQAGRLLNRRVEIKGLVSDVVKAQRVERFRTAPQVIVDGTPLAIDALGRFQTTLPMDQPRDQFTLTLEQADGKRLVLPLLLPTLTLVAPGSETLWLRHGHSDATYQLGLPLTGGATERRASYRLEGFTATTTQLELDGERVALDKEGRFTAPLILDEAPVSHDLVAQNAQGVRRIVTLTLSLSHQLESGEPYYLVPPVPNIEVVMPPKGVVLRSTLYTVTGQTEAGNRVEINGAAVTVDAQGKFAQTLTLSPGENPLKIRTIDRAGFSTTLEQQVTVKERNLFLLAFADGKISQIQPSAFDSGKTEQANRLFRDLNSVQTERLLTQLDPNTLYPVYGDGSTLVNDVQSQGKFYLAIESTTFNAKVGNYALNFSETELAAFQRTLYGVEASYRSEGKVDSGQAKSAVQAFASTVEQVHVRDELRTTGGSLYYLSHGQVIEGSEQLTLVIRDKDTGLVLSRQPLTVGQDYDLDAFAGRLLMSRPLASLASPFTGGGERLIASVALGGHPQYLQVDYEVKVSGYRQNGGGVRLEQQLGPVRLGATAINDDLGMGPYTLNGLDATIALNRYSRLQLELANSRGSDGVNYTSDDGGLSYASRPGDQSANGQAWKVAGELDLGAWFDQPERYTLSFYAKQLGAGFLANGTQLDGGRSQQGVTIKGQLSKRDTVTLRYDHSTTQGEINPLNNNSGSITSTTPSTLGNPTTPLSGTALGGPTA
ncbi:MAG: hypothetical protein FD130_1951, partial [Halothiobacillaceae bacterium]